MRAVDFDHDGKPYSLRFDFNAMGRYERQMGETMAQFLGNREEINKRGSIDVARTLTILWAALNVRMTTDEVGFMIEQMGFSKANKLAFDAVSQALELLNNDPSLPRTDKKAGAESGNG